MSTKVVDRSPLTFYERSYLPAILGGLQVTAKLRIELVEPHQHLAHATQRLLRPGARLGGVGSAGEGGGEQRGDVGGPHDAILVG